MSESGNSNGFSEKRSQNHGANGPSMAHATKSRRATNDSIVAEAAEDGAHAYAHVATPARTATGDTRAYTHGNGKNASHGSNATMPTRSYARWQDTDLWEQAYDRADTHTQFLTPT